MMMWNILNFILGIPSKGFNSPTIVKLMLLPIYATFFIVLTMFATMYYTLCFFFLGPFAPIVGLIYGLSAGLRCFTNYSPDKESREPD